MLLRMHATEISKGAIALMPREIGGIDIAAGVGS